MHLDITTESRLSPIPVGPDEGAVRIPLEAVQRLSELADSAHVSLPTVFVVLAGVLVHRYVGWDTVDIGASIGSDVEMSADLSLAPSDTLWLASLAFDGDPTIALALRRAADAAVPPPAVSLQLWLQSEDQLHSLVRSSFARCTTGASKRQRICLSVVSGDHGLHVSAAVSNVNDAELSSRLARHFCTLAMSGAAGPDTPVSQLELLDPLEYRQTVIDWNSTEQQHPNGALHELFDTQANATPDVPALRCAGQLLTYRQLQRRANQLARHLRARGVRLESPVGVCLERSIDAVVTVLGVLKAGGTYVPLDPGYPSARIAEMLADCAPSVVVTREQHRALFAQSSVPIVDLDLDASALAATATTGPDVAVTPANAAYILYTSGSAGKPKPIVGTHASVTNGMCDVPFRRGDPDDVCCLDASLSFGFSLARTFLPLLCGHTLVILPGGPERDLVGLVKFWEAERIGNIAMVTPVCRQLLGFGPRLTSKLQRVHTVLVGGALITPELMSSFFDDMPNASLVVGYAASEIGGPILKKELTAASQSVSPSIGRQYPNVRVYLLDSALHPVPVGVIGEIYVTAAHLSRGYLNRPAHTAERYVANPFAIEPGERLYRTGDIGRYWPDGELELLGRIDDMVKVRGYRIELQEIEAALSAHPQVDSASAAVRELDGELQIVGYVVARAGESIRTSHLRSFLAQRLPDYMLPSRFAVLDTLPLTPLGKVDRGRLPEVSVERPALATPYEAPLDEIEKEIATLWESLLHMSGIGVDDDFLELGGDSIFATMLTARLCDRYDIDLSVATIFEWPTVRHLSAHVRSVLSRNIQAR